MGMNMAPLISKNPVTVLLLNLIKLAFVLRLNSLGNIDGINPLQSMLITHNADLQ